MSIMDHWAEAIALERDQNGVPLLGSVITHVRDAVIEGGFVTKGRITSGLKEAYRPFAIDESDLRPLIDEAIRLLVLGGDLDELTTGAGRGYAATPARQVHWGGSQHTLLGGLGRSSKDVVRRIESAEGIFDGAMMTTLSMELGRPAWRDILVQLDGADQPDSDASALTEFAQALTSSGTRYSLEEPEAVAVLSGRSEFFGSADPPKGRWRRIEGDGFYPANIRSGYTNRSVLLAVQGNEATLWQPPSHDIWKWIVVGYTLKAGDPVLRYDCTQAKLDFLTPPPMQAERAALLTGQQLSAWSWQLDQRAYQVIVTLLGSPR